MGGVGFQVVAQLYVVQVHFHCVAFLYKPIISLILEANIETFDRETNLLVREPNSQID